MKKRVDSTTSNRKRVLKLIVLLIGVLCWMNAIYNQKLMAEAPGTVSVRFKDSGVSKKEIDNILESMLLKQDVDIPEVTLWQRDENALIRNEDIKKSFLVDLVTVAGDMSEIYPGTILFGGYLPPEDYEGCVIDNITANVLFGSEDIVGMELTFMDKSYIIRGIMKSTVSNIMIIHEATQGTGEEYKLYNCMELDFSDYQNAERLAKNFILAYGFDEPSAYSNSYQYQGFAELLIHLPVWICVLWMISFLVRKVYSLKYSLVLSLTGYLLVAAISMMLIKLADIHISYPVTLIPSRWSDFDFWTEKWMEVTGSLRGKEGMVYCYKDILLRNRLFYVTAGVVLAVMSEWMIIRSFYNKSKYMAQLKETNNKAM